MPAIPRYWYVETGLDGFAFEHSPETFVDVPSPAIGDDQIIFDPETGEIYGEAILMSALPSPRFRNFGSEGKEVVLPHRTAVTLEWLENVAIHRECPHCHSQSPEWKHHVAVEVLDPERLAFHFICHRHIPLKSRGPAPRAAPCASRRGREGPRQGL